ncbi:MAG TPA: FHA domain-containing protein [Gemmataceae bacterium]|nr:FHA domain-containing protein [Gemmataceae bacterium]
MADPRLNSLHLETPRRQEYRRARDVLLHARGSQTICACHDDSQAFGRTVIQRQHDVAEAPSPCWLLDGEFLYPLHIGVNTLGRSSDNDLVVEDAYVSRRHGAILVHVNEKCELHDTASKNGIYLNGTRLSEPAVLKSGDEIRVSNRQFVFFTRSGDPAAAFPPATLSG